MTSDGPPLPSASPGARRRLAALLPDLAPWRSSRDFRLLWCAGAITVFGTFLTVVALPLQLKELTGSTLAVGALGAVELVPLLVFGLYGGALADFVDRRRLIVVSELALGLISALLLLNSLLPHPQVWPLYAAAALSSALTGLQRPALDAIVPRIVRHDQLAAAAALNSLRWQIGAIAGPALAGGLLAAAGLRWAYALDAVTYVLSMLLTRKLAPSPASHDAEKPSLRGIAEGARYAWSRKELLGTYAVDVLAMLFAFPLAIFPFLADELDAPWSLGMMYAALPAGALVVSLTSGWTARVHRQGRAIVLAAVGWGLAIAAAGQLRQVWLVLLLLALAGACDMISGIFRSALWNRTIPDELRGRLAGIELLSYATGPQLGQVRVGGMAALMGVRASVSAGGLLCFAGVGLLALGLPKLRAYDSRTDEHARRMRERRAAGADNRAYDRAGADGRAGAGTQDTDPNPDPAPV
ncbi:putative MFS family arabinose efflux permease [Streptomyces sp. 2333.5]|uniref:MFS transporter n=1 Tax=unclassified Streptomyces TaxID=2593676 RepID=UPI0008995BBB|nr:MULTISPECIES: MFS transporter [unclassified Streptomyces]PJJ01605.1 putative MFS family arabinose efflux permease [Streptomyces sp. 2333.5]SEC71065.1 Predicted arabinose efflux permease, MFS family [Streptomyces sp. 2314.4]SED49947.1 Predicted arabinose efflux permease, MFS family [Streptomyces sp. 2112.2]